MVWRETRTATLSAQESKATFPDATEPYTITMGGDVRVHDLEVAADDSDDASQDPSWQVGDFSNEAGSSP